MEMINHIIRLRVRLREYTAVLNGTLQYIPKTEETAKYGTI